MGWAGIALATLVLVGAPTSAFAQTSERADPNSPAGAEYQLPLEGARKYASPGGGVAPTGTGRSTSSPSRADPRGKISDSLFGAGVEPLTSQRSRDGSKTRRPAPGAGSSRATGGASPRAVSSALAAGEGSGWTNPTTLVLATLVLLVGALLGGILRRRNTRRA